MSAMLLQGIRETLQECMTRVWLFKDPPAALLPTPSRKQEVGI